MENVNDGGGLIGDSAAQMAAEKEMILAFGREQGIEFESSKRNLPLDGIKVEIDGYGTSGHRILLVEAFARTKKPLCGQKRKILTDAFKLVFLTQRLANNQPNAKIEGHLVFLSAAVRDSVGRENWASAALSHFNIKAHVVSVGENVKIRVQRAEQNQAKNQAGKRPPLKAP